MKKTSHILGILVILLITAHCGSTGKIKPTAHAQTHQKTGQQQATVNLSNYDRIVVEDFTDGYSSRLKGKKKQRAEFQLRKVTTQFTEMLSDELHMTLKAREIVRNGIPDDKTLIIRGQVTQYKKGNAFSKVMIGFGAGSSKFDALVELCDGMTGQVLGTIKVDKNSWALGGFVAAAQTAEYFMETAVQQIATNLQKQWIAYTETATPLQSASIR